MDTGDGPSRSGRGGGQWQNNRGGYNNYNNYNNNRGRGSNRGYSSPGNRGGYNNGYSASGFNTSGYSNQSYGQGAGGRQAWGGRGQLLLLIACLLDACLIACSWSAHNTCNSGQAMMLVGRGRGRGRAAGRGPLHFPDPEDIKFLKVMKGHTKKVTSIAINPDAQQVRSSLCLPWCMILMHSIEAETAISVQIYTGSADKTLRVWHMETGQVSISSHSSTISTSELLLQHQCAMPVAHGVTPSHSPMQFVCLDLQCIQTIDAGGEVDSMLLSGKMLIVGLHVSTEEGMVRAWHIDTGSDVVLPGRHRVRPCSLPIASTNITTPNSCLQHLTCAQITDNT